MKYAIVLPDGAADEPLAQLGGRTPLEAATIPNMDWVATHGRLGRVVTIPDGFTPGTDVGTLSLLGYDPHICYTGRAPLEAAARGLVTEPGELIFRCNFVTIEHGRMKDFTAGHIAQPDAERLVEDLNDLARQGNPSLDGCRFSAGVSYRNLLVAAGAADMQLMCIPPHDIPGQLVADELPRGKGQQRVQRIMACAHEMLEDHEINQRRAERGEPLVTDIWLWGQGRPVKLRQFHDRFGVRGAVITGVDIIRGLAAAAGIDRIDVEGATGYIDTDYAAKGAAAVRALEDYDLVIVHVEAPDEAGHLGNAEEKARAIERTDEDVVGPLLDARRGREEWRILIAVDHPTPCTTKRHDAAPPLFGYAGTRIEPSTARRFTERHAAGSGWVVNPGWGLADLFFRV